MMIQSAFTSVLATSVILIVAIFLIVQSIAGGLYPTVYSEVGDDVTFSIDTQIYIAPGKEDCFYHYVYTNNLLHFEYKVVKGGDGQIGVNVRDPNGYFVLQPELKDGGQYRNENVQIPGYYAFCIDNQHSTFAGKIVAFYLITYNAKHWEKFAEEFEKLDLSVNNATANLSLLDSRITQVLNHLFLSRALESRDNALLQRNNFYVSLFSGLQCAIILIAGFIHVTILKSLFKEKSHGTFKVRL